MWTVFNRGSRQEKGFLTVTATLLCVVSQTSAQDIGGATAEKLSDA
jgi:hypothetical protein